MNTKKFIKIAVDVLMALIFLASMGYGLWGDFLHEVLGTALFMLFVIHHVLNFQWYKAIFKGKYSVYRVFVLLLNIFLTVCVIGLMISGIMISKHIFAFVEITGGISFARVLHLSVSYWSYVVTSMHIGIHLNSAIQKSVSKSQNIKIIFIALSVIISAFGIYAFVKRDFASYMFLKTQFAFIDFNESLIVFCIEHFSIMWLFGCVSCLFSSHLKKIKMNRR